MSNCTHFVELINKYVDNMLNEKDEKELMTHINECDECRTRFEMMKLLTSEMSHMEEDVPVGFTESVMNKVRHEKKNAFLRIITSRPFIASTAAVALIALCVSIPIGNSAKSSDSASSESASIAYDAASGNLSTGSSAVTESGNEADYKKTSDGELEVADTESSSLQFSSSSSSAASVPSSSIYSETEDHENDSNVDTLGSNKKMESVILADSITGKYKMITVIYDEQASFNDLSYDLYVTDDYNAIVMSSDDYSKFKSENDDVKITEYTDTNEFPNIDADFDDILIIIYNEKQ